MLVRESLPEDLPRIDKSRIAEPEKFWALYATSFYEHLFALIDTKRLLKKAYAKKIKQIQSKEEAVEALNFFYRIRRDELDGITIWESMLFESPDMIEARNLSQIIHGKKSLDLSDIQVPFGYYDGKMKIGKIGGIHPDIKKDYNDIDQYALSRFDLKYPGRIWLKEKVISFWKYPETHKDLYDVLSDIENEFFRKFKRPWSINPNDWQIEIVDKKLEGDNFPKRFMEWADAEDAILIPVKDYYGSDEWSEETKAKEHIQSPMEKKKKKVPYGIGSNNPNIKPLPWKQAMYSESKLAPSFQEFLNS